MSKYDSSGTEIWTRQFGTSLNDYAYDVCADDSGVYVVGTTGGTLSGQISAGSLDAFIRKYDMDGIELWTRQFGTTGGDQAYGICADDSGVYITGNVQYTLPDQTSLGGIDAYVRKYDTDGVEQWACQFGTDKGDFAKDISIDNSGVYVIGQTYGTFPGQANIGVMDVFVQSLSTDGALQWTCQFGASQYDDETASPHVPRESISREL